MVKNLRASALPALPEPSALTLDQVMALERQITASLRGIDDPQVLNEWRDRATALVAYLRGREVVGPMVAAQRKIEARIGQLLMPAPQPADTGGRRGNGPDPGREWERELIPHPNDRRAFRYLARALAGEVTLTEEEWQRGREAVVAIIRGKLGEAAFADGKGVYRRREERGRRGHAPTLHPAGQEASWLINALGNLLTASEVALEVVDAKEQLTDGEVAELRAQILEVQRRVRRIKKALREHKADDGSGDG